MREGASGRGDRIDDRDESFEDVAVREAQNEDASRTKIGVALIVFDAPGIVHGTVDLDRERELRAVEVDDIAENHVLPPKPPTGDLSLAQRGP